jgi:hypothetical protein
MLGGAGVVFLLLVSSASAAVHPYHGEYFYAVGDAYIFRGGREGMFASTQEVRPADFPIAFLLCCKAFGRTTPLGNLLLTRLETL